MKKFLLGLLIGAIVFSAVGVWAVNYVAEPASFKVLVNGKELVSDPPALVVEGRTYLPLRAVGDALGVPVVWNAEKNQAEVGNTAEKAESNEYSRQNPAPINTIQTYTKTSDWFEEDNYTVSVRVMETVRGEEEISKLRKSVITDDKPTDGYELMMVKIAFSVLKTNNENDNAIEPNKYDFTPFTSNNEETEHAYLHMDGSEGFDWLGGKIYPGGSTEGWIVVQVKKDDKNPKLAYGLDYDGAGGIWFALQ